MFKDLVSIVITNYNYGKYLPRAIRSCLSQNFADVEVLIIDDNSNDDSEKALEPFLFLPQQKLRVIRNTDNKGVAYCTNL